jgi:hypothetical protein
MRAEPLAQARKKMPDRSIDMENKYCRHEGEYSWWEEDAQGIPLCRVCDKCEQLKLAQYRPEILSGYTQSDVDEPIEPLNH